MAVETQKNPRAYEVLFILRPSLSDEEIAGEVEKVKTTIVQRGGEVVWVENMGKKKLAYEIRKERRGVYVLIHFKGAQNTAFDLRQMCRIQDWIMRFMLVQIQLKELRSSDSAPGASAPANAPSPSMGGTA